MGKLNKGQYQLLLEIQMYELVESYIKFHGVSPHDAVDKLQDAIYLACEEYCEEKSIDMDGNTIS